jgi:hypothetical protein
VDGVLLTGPVGRTHADDLRRAASQLAPTVVLGVTLLQAGKAPKSDACGECDGGRRRLFR